VRGLLYRVAGILATPKKGPMKHANRLTDR